MRIFGIAGWSGSGKTTLLIGLIPALRQLGFSVSTIKHAHHRFDIDKPGKDSWHHREAGASEVLIASTQRWVLQHENRDGPEASMEELLERLSPVDLVLVEGFKTNRFPKLEVVRPSLGQQYHYLSDPTVVAVASFETVGHDAYPLPFVATTDLAGIAELVLKEARNVGQAL